MYKVIKIYIHRKRFAFVTVEYTKEIFQDILTQLQSEKPFMRIAGVILNKGDVLYVRCK